MYYCPGKERFLRESRNYFPLMEVSNCWYRAHGYRWLLGTHVLSAPMTLFCRLAVPWGEVRLPENHVKGRTNSWTSKEKGKLLLPWMVCLHKGWQIGQTFLPQSSHQGQTPKQKRENAIVLEEEFALLACMRTEKSKFISWKRKWKSKVLD